MANAKYAIYFDGITRTVRYVDQGFVQRYLSEAEPKLHSRFFSSVQLNGLGLAMAMNDKVGEKFLFDQLDGSGPNIGSALVFRVDRNASPVPINLTMTQLRQRKENGGLGGRFAGDFFWEDYCDPNPWQEVCMIVPFILGLFGLDYGNWIGIVSAILHCAYILYLIYTRF